MRSKNKKNSEIYKRQKSRSDGGIRTSALQAWCQRLWPLGHCECFKSTFEIYYAWTMILQKFLNRKNSGDLGIEYWHYEGHFYLYFKFFQRSQRDISWVFLVRLRLDLGLMTTILRHSRKTKLVFWLNHGSQWLYLSRPLLFIFRDIYLTRVIKSFESY